MESLQCFVFAGAGLFFIGVRALVVEAHFLRKILAINLMGSGAFLALVAPAQPGDPVPQAMVITGIVVAVSATALALNLMLKVVRASGRTTFGPDDAD